MGRILWALSCLALAVSLSGAPRGGMPREYLVQAWDTDAGLPHSTVTSIAQTPDGYLWIGTLHGGLARFDGQRFVNFHPGNTPELKSIEIQKLLVDHQGTLWIGLVEGILLSYRDGRFHFERQNTETPQNWIESCLSSSSNTVVLASPWGWIFRGRRAGDTSCWETSFPPPPPDQQPNANLPCMDREGTIWYRTPQFHLGRLQGTNFIALDQPPGLRHPQINAMDIGADGRLWVGTERELAVWDGHGFVDMTPTNGPSALAVRHLAPCHDGSFWVRTDDQLQKCAGRTWLVSASPWTKETRPPPTRLSLYADSRGEAWVAHHGEGLWHVGNDGHAIHIAGLPSNIINCWFEDREGNIWGGLVGGGLVHLRPRIFHLLWPADSPRSSAKTVCEDDQHTVWIGTGDNKLIRYRDGELDPLPLPASGSDATVYPAGRARLWAGSVQSGVFLLERDSFTRPFSPAAVNTVARVLHADRTGALWIGNEFGLFRWSEGRMQKLSSEEGFTPAYVLAIAEGATGDLWFGTATGELRRFADGHFQNYHPEDSLTDDAVFRAAATADPVHNVGRGTLSSGGERFWSLYADPQGALWIGTLGGGLLRFKDGCFTRYGLRQGLPSEHISQILEDDHGRLWLGMRNGIARVSKAALNEFALGKRKELPCVTYGKFDGLPALECAGGSQPACWHGADERLWFTTIKGAVWMDPDTLPANQLPPPVFVESVSVDGRELAIDSPRTAPDALRVGAGRHYFEFKFTALSLTSPEKIRFQWRLWGLEREWVDGGSQRSVSYSFVPPGHYRFQVRACNNDGIWNQEGATLALVVPPYFWQTWWFKLAAAAFVTLALAAGYSVRVAQLKSLERLRLRIARDLHDEVGANLASISLLAQLMETSPSTADASHVRSLAERTIDTLRNIIWFIDPQHDRLEDLLIRLEDNARAMLAGIPYEFQRSGDFRSATLPLVFRRNVLPIFKETLHNIVKHARADRVEISVRRGGNTFEFRVKDNGIGFTETGKQLGIGLKNMRRRATEIGGTLTIVSRPGSGTTVSLAAPLTQTRDWWRRSKPVASTLSGQSPGR